ncbi:hypothetical protein PHAVU_008G051100 [Phaseolus vulgaris]|uniref:Probable purine permease n=1 Tax=Phaseolus vulgaris TaxID=3885 RepID=V7B5H2_PHAVU|nr:hypothetical protein PHAVU_008G051100g [Phaseolus vulgaris]ESW11686.1 hypothetical protein PHAVU_008G051100g [Phaseolus vulgaris]
MTTYSPISVIHHHCVPFLSLSFFSRRPQPSSLLHMADSEEPMIAPGTISELAFNKYKRWQWWFLVALCIGFLIIGQCAAVILGRFYYDQGGNSKWMATLVQTAAFPLLFIPLYTIPAPAEASTSASPSIKIILLIYFVLGVLVAADNMMYSTGLLYLSASTYALICASQLAFNAVFSYFINAQKFTVLIINSTVILTLSASLLAVNEDSEEPSGLAKGKYIIGFLCTLGASALYSLLLSLMQLTFEKVLKKETFSVVLEMQIYTSLVATSVSVIGLFASGESHTLHGEMEGFGKGQVAYVMTLVWTAVAWQVCSVGVVGLIFLVSSLYSNVISTVSLAVTPIAAVIVFHDKMNGVKIISMLLAIWGFVSYIYQNYLDDSKARHAQAVARSQNDTAC